MKTIYILWLRQMKRFSRSGIRIVMSVVQPLVYLLALGFGLNKVFEQSGRGHYIDFIVPGIVAQTILFNAIFWGVGIMWDKQFGFLKETLVAPVSRTNIMLGNALGGATIAVIQGVMLLIISIIFGFRPYSLVLLVITFVVMSMLALSMVSFSAGIAAIMNDMQGFMAVNNLLVIPLFFLSSALYPLDSVPTAMKIIASLNPLTYAVDALRMSLIHQSHFPLWQDFTVLGATLVLLFSFGVYRFKRIQA
jgi:ABC-2 type transport system permease protein